MLEYDADGVVNHTPNAPPSQQQQGKQSLLLPAAAACARYKRVLLLTLCCWARGSSLLPGCALLYICHLMGFYTLRSCAARASAPAAAAAFHYKLLYNMPDARFRIFLHLMIISCRSKMRGFNLFLCRTVSCRTRSLLVTPMRKVEHRTITTNIHHDLVLEKKLHYINMPAIMDDKVRVLRIQNILDLSLCLWYLLRLIGRKSQKVVQSRRRVISSWRYFM